MPCFVEFIEKFCYVMLFAWMFIEYYSQYMFLSLPGWMSKHTTVGIMYSVCVCVRFFLKIWNNLNQVIQFVTFSSPIVGGHKKPSQKGSRMTIPKKGTSRIARWMHFCDMLCIYTLNMYLQLEGADHQKLDFCLRRNCWFFEPLAKS